MDIRVDNHGSIMIVTPVTAAGKEWVDLHLNNSEMQRWAGGIVVEPRYLQDIIDGAEADGLVVGSR